MNLTREQKALITILEGKVELMKAQDNCHLSVEQKERDTLHFVLATYVKVAEHLNDALKKVEELEEHAKELKADLDGCADQLSAG